MTPCAAHGGYERTVRMFRVWVSMRASGAEAVLARSSQRRQQELRRARGEAGEGGQGRAGGGEEAPPSSSFFQRRCPIRERQRPPGVRDAARGRERGRGRGGEDATPLPLPSCRPPLRSSSCARSGRCRPRSCAPSSRPAADADADAPARQRARICHAAMLSRASLPCTSRMRSVLGCTTRSHRLRVTRIMHAISLWHSARLLRLFTPSPVKSMLHASRTALQSLSLTHKEKGQAPLLIRRHLSPGLAFQASFQGAGAFLSGPRMCVRTGNESGEERREGRSALSKPATAATTWCNEHRRRCHRRPCRGAADARAGTCD